MLFMIASTFPWFAISIDSAILSGKNIQEIFNSWMFLQDNIALLMLISNDKDYKLTLCVWGSKCHCSISSIYSQTQSNLMSIFWILGRFASRIITEQKSRLLLWDTVLWRM